MSKTITIGSTPVDIPTSGESPNWGASVTKALELLTDAVNSVTGIYDIQPQVFNINSYNAATVDITGLAFPSSVISGATIIYSVYRKVTESGVIKLVISEEGTLEIAYNPENTVGNLWEITRTFTGSESHENHISFDISDEGQVNFTTQSIMAGFPLGVHTGFISFRAFSQLNS